MREHHTLEYLFSDTHHMYMCIDNPLKSVCIQRQLNERQQRIEGLSLNDIPGQHHSQLTPIRLLSRNTKSIHFYHMSLWTQSQIQFVY